MNELLNYLKIVKVDTAVAIASLAVSVAATLIAKSSLSRSEDSLDQAKRVADREQADWRQRKWFDLYQKANEAYDALEAFQVKYVSTTSPHWKTGEWKAEFNDLIYCFRAIHAMAMVFPMNSVVTELCLCTAVFKNPEEMLSKERLRIIFNVMDQVREKAMVNTTILD